jgi:hypothetical protein
MLRVLGRPSAACDGITRRDLLRAGSLAALTAYSGGLRPPLARADESRGTTAPAKAVILLDLFGGPSHIDTFDPKPAAPPEIRGELAPSRPPFPASAFANTCRNSPAGSTSSRSSAASRTGTTRTTRMA